MNIIPITSSEPACFGVLCEMHERCARYHAAEGTPVVTLDTCRENGEYPMFAMHQPKAEVSA